jgi:hypothetical protein
MITIFDFITNTHILCVLWLLLLKQDAKSSHGIILLLYDKRKDFYFNLVFRLSFFSIYIYIFSSIVNIFKDMSNCKDCALFFKGYNSLTYSFLFLLNQNLTVIYTFFFFFFFFFHSRWFFFWLTRYIANQAFNVSLSDMTAPGITPGKWIEQEQEEEYVFNRVILVHEQQQPPTINLDLGSLTAGTAPNNRKSV